MSTLKTINIIHPSGSTNNIVNDASGNITVGNNITVTGTLTGSTGVMNIGSGQLYKDSSGNVGIGTSSPQAYGAGYTTLTIDASTSPGLDLRVSGTRYGRIYASTSNLTIDTWSGVTPIIFSTNTAERMRIDSSGNVGIGTSSPGSKLQVNGTTAFIGAGYYQVSGGAGNYGTNTTFYSGGGDIAVAVGTNSGGYAYQTVTTGHALAFGTSNTERMRIDSSGNVLVGGTTAFGKLSLYANGVYASSGSMNSGMTISNGTGGGALNIGVNDTGTFSTSYTWLNSGYINNSNSPLPFVLATGGSEAARIDSSGVLCIGGTNQLPGYSNNVSGAAIQGDGTACFSKQGNITSVINNGGSGQVLTQYNYRGTEVGKVLLNGTTGVLYQTSSDYRLKENVQPMTDGLATVLALKPVRYDWISDKSAGEGFLAHELQEVISQAVSGQKDAVDENGNPIHQGVDYSKIVVHLVAAIQELKAEIDALKGAKS